MTSGSDTGSCVIAVYLLCACDFLYVASLCFRIKHVLLKVRSSTAGRGNVSKVCSCNMSEGNDSQW